MRAAALLALLLAACGAPPSPQAGPPVVRGITLCVQNETAAFGRIKAVVPTVGTLRVEPGATECKVVSATLGTVTLYAETIAGGLRYQTRWSPGGTRCGLWRLSNVQASEINLTPCRAAMRMDAGPDTVPGAVPFAILEQAMGVTVCQSRPAAWVNVEVLGTEDALATIEHEQEHARQMRRSGSCAEHWRRVDADPSLAKRLEAEAYCVGAKAWAKQNRKPFVLGVVRYSEWLARYGFGLTPAEAEALIASSC